MLCLLRTQKQTHTQAPSCLDWEKPKGRNELISQTKISVASAARHPQHGVLKHHGSQSPINYHLFKKVKEVVEVGEAAAWQHICTPCGPLEEEKYA